MGQPGFRLSAIVILLALLLAGGMFLVLVSRDDPAKVLEFTEETEDQPAGIADTLSHNRTRAREKLAREEKPDAPGRDQATETAVKILDGTVTGRFVDSRGFPLPGVRIELSGQSILEASAVSASEGWFEARVVFKPANRVYTHFDWQALGEGFMLERGANTVAPGRNTDLGEIVLVPGSPVSGFVVDHSGTPLPGASVFLDLDPGPLSEFYVQQIRYYGLEVHDGQVATARDGSFRFPGVRPGPLRLWAEATGFYSNNTSILEVQAHAALPEIEIVLKPMEWDRIISGRVLSPEGAPVPTARVLTHYRFDEGEGGDILPVDADGRFVCVVDRKLPHDLRAEDEQEQYSPVRAIGVLPGTKDLDLVLNPLRKIRVKVTTKDESPLPGFEIFVFSPTPETEAGIAYFSPRNLDAGGTVSMIIPYERFYVGVFAQAFQRAIEGPFEPDRIPDPIAIELHPHPPVQGRVIETSGTPIAKATVSCIQTDMFRPTGIHDAFRVFPHRSRSRTVKTDKHGVFRLYLEESARVTFHAEKTGFSPADTEEIEIDGTRGYRGIVIILERQERSRP